MITITVLKGLFILNMILNLIDAGRCTASGGKRERKPETTVECILGFVVALVLFLGLVYGV